VLVNGRDAAEFSLESWARLVAFVPQEPRLLKASVTENIRFFRDWVTDEDVLRAAKQAHIHDEVLSWPNGYDTIVSDRVEAVSGGQRQRLCIARALAGRPDFLVLDEPTSGLDGRSESLIQESLSDLKGDVTMVIVAHRLSTLTLCDRIMVLRDGRLEAFDTAESLERSNAFFREAVRLAKLGGGGPTSRPASA
jgi:ABC-type multidrug transport system fused ATPase/permease subunit